MDYKLPAGSVHMAFQAWMLPDTMQRICPLRNCTPQDFWSQNERKRFGDLASLMRRIERVARDNDLFRQSPTIQQVNSMPCSPPTGIYPFLDNKNSVQKWFMRYKKFSFLEMGLHEHFSERRIWRVQRRSLSFPSKNQLLWLCNSLFLCHLSKISTTGMPIWWPKRRVPRANENPTVNPSLFWLLINNLGHSAMHLTSPLLQFSPSAGKTTSW